MGHHELHNHGSTTTEMVSLCIIHFITLPNNGALWVTQPWQQQQQRWCHSASSTSSPCQTMGHHELHNHGSNNNKGQRTLHMLSTLSSHSSMHRPNHTHTSTTVGYITALNADSMFSVYAQKESWNWLWCNQPWQTHDGGADNRCLLCVLSSLNTHCNSISKFPDKCPFLFVVGSTSNKTTMRQEAENNKRSSVYRINMINKDEVNSAFSNNLLKNIYILFH